MTRIEPELWVDEAHSAVDFYQAAFEATVLHLVGDGHDIVAQLDVQGARFWIVAASASMNRFSPKAIGGTTSRTLLKVDDPEAVVNRALGVGAAEMAPVRDEHG